MSNSLNNTTAVIVKPDHAEPLWDAVLDHAETKGLLKGDRPATSSTYEQSLSSKYLLSSDITDRVSFGWLNGGTMRVYFYINKLQFSILFANKQYVEAITGPLNWDCGNAKTKRARIHVDTAFVNDSQALDWYINTWLKIDTALAALPKSRLINKPIYEYITAHATTKRAELIESIVTIYGKSPSNAGLYVDKWESRTGNKIPK